MDFSFITKVVRYFDDMWLRRWLYTVQAEVVDGELLICGWTYEGCPIWAPAPREG